LLAGTPNVQDLKVRKSPFSFSWSWRISEQARISRELPEHGGEFPRRFTVGFEQSIEPAGWALSPVFGFTYAEIWGALPG